MKIELLKLTDDATNFIGDCSGICYNSKRTVEANTKRAVSCLDRGHLATLRFATATFHVTGISRICSHQFVRSKHLEFLQQSQRYVNQSEVGFVYPKTSLDYQISIAYQYAMNVYESLIKQGMKKEDARFVLSAGIQTELVVTGNFQAWKDFIALRSGKDAQQEIRSVAIRINNTLAEHCPLLFEVME